MHHKIFYHQCYNVTEFILWVLWMYIINAAATVTLKAEHWEAELTRANCVWWFSYVGRKDIVLLIICFVFVLKHNFDRSSDIIFVTQQKRYTEVKTPIPLGGFWKDFGSEHQVQCILVNVGILIMAVWPLKNKEAFSFKLENSVTTGNALQ